MNIEPDPGRKLIAILFRNSYTIYCIVDNMYLHHKGRKRELYTVDGHTKSSETNVSALCRPVVFHLS